MYKLSILSNPKNLAKIRKEIRYIAEKSGFNKNDTVNIVLAVDEACTNIIRHSYLNNYRKRINLKAAIKKKQLEITIRHYGIKPDPKKLRGCCPKKIRPGGLGVYFIKNIMDKVVYSGRKLILCKSRQK